MKKRTTIVVRLLCSVEFHLWICDDNKKNLREDLKLQKECRLHSFKHKTFQRFHLLAAIQMDLNDNDYRPMMVSVDSLKKKVTERVIRCLFSVWKEEKERESGKRAHACGSRIRDGLLLLKETDDTTPGIGYYSVDTHCGSFQTLFARYQQTCRPGQLSIKTCSKTIK